MSKGIFVVGTDTGVGKTIVSAGIVLSLRGRGISVGVIKPFATGCVWEGRKWQSEDARLLIQAAGFDKVEEMDVSPVCFEEPLAPYVAALRQGESLSIAKAIAAYHKQRERFPFLVVEGIGGLLVPITKKYFVRDLIADLGLPALVVGRAGLGTINHTLMTLELLAQRKIPVIGFILNGREEASPSLAEETNPEVVQELSGITCLGVLPWINGFQGDEASLRRLGDAFEQRIGVDVILKGAEGNG